MATPRIGVGPRLAPTLAAVIVAVVFCGTALFGLAGIDLNSAEFTFALFCMAVLLGVQMLHFGRPAVELRSRRTVVLLILQAPLAFLPLLAFGQAWVSMPSFFAGNLLLVLRPPVSWLALVAFGAVMSLVQAALSGSVLDIAYTPVATMTFAMEIYGLTRLARLVTELHETRTELARMAVADERLRFGRDLHDLLGLSLSAIALKGELAHRQMRERPERSARELAEILAICRRALGDVRSVADGYAELSLEQEYESTLSVLTAAEVEVRITREYTSLPPGTRTVLATVLREGVTNVLRHSKAEWCEVTVRQHDDSVTLDIVNNGVGEHTDQAQPASGGGIRNLTHRVAAVGGRLETRMADPRQFQLHVHVPLDGQAAVRPSTVTPQALPADRTPPVPPADQTQATPAAGQTPPALPTPAAQPAGQAPGPRTPVGPITFVLCAMMVAACLHVLYLTWVPWEVVLSFGCLAALLAVQLGYFTRPDLRTVPRVTLGLLLVQAVLVYLPLVVLGPVWVSLPGFLAGSALLVLHPLVAWSGFAAVLLSVGVIQHVYTGSETNVVFNVVATAISGLVVYGLTWLSWLISEQRQARRQLAELAVVKERLRFARHLHELLGLSLAAITQRCELVLRLMVTDRGRAEDELVEVQAQARRALADVRSTASDYRRAPMGEELDPTEVVLAADAIVRLELLHGELPVQVRRVLAAMVREGIVTVPSARVIGPHHEVVVRQSPTHVSLEIVAGRPRPAPDGVDAVAEMVNDLGGELTAGVDGRGHYRLTATIPR